VVSDTAAATAPAGRRLELLDAAVHVIAAEGLRGLTHRAVDRRAGLAEGTCSAYLRSRQALQVGLAEHVGRSLAHDVDVLAARLEEARTGDPERDEPLAIELTTGLLGRWLDRPELTLAKAELAVEASRNPEVAAVLTAWRARLVTVVDQLVTRVAPDAGAARAEVLVAALDGLLLAALQRPAAERQGFLGDSLALVLHGLTQP
jgi:DNA-binding transcriptional regulator YbjK